MSKKLIKGSLLATTVIAGVAFAVPAFAQDASQTAAGTSADATAQPSTAAPTEAPAGGKDIVVTGTLIRNPNLVASAPVTVVGQDEIRLKQSNVAEEVLRTIPGAVPSIGSNVNNGNGGASFVNLRGLGSGRNIVLLDGVRIAPAGLGGQVDLNNIPLALVDRVDVLTGGASSTYGADAVGGVVNFITRNNFAGMELSASDQITQKGDGNVIRTDLTIGANFDDGRGNAVISLGYQEADPVYQGGDRAYSETTIESYQADCVPCAGSATTVPARVSIRGTSWQVTPDGSSFQNPVYQRFNFNPYNVYQTPFKRYNMYSAGHYDITDGLTVYARGLYSNNTVDTIIAPSGIFGSAVTVNLNNPYLTTAQRNIICSGFGMTQATCDAAGAATGTSDPNYRQVTLGIGRRTTEVGPRISDYNTQLWDFRVGVRGNITDSITFDVFGSRGESVNTQTIQNYVLLSRVKEAALADNTTTCQSLNAACVPINLFGPEGTITPSMVDFLTDDSSTKTTTRLSQARGTISGDFGVGSPWSSDPIGFAVGAEYRDYYAAQRADALAKMPGELGGAGGGAPDITGGFSVYEGFAEVIAPLITDKPGFDKLTIDAGIRRSAYTVNAAGQPTFKTTTWKVEGNWAPVKDIMFRGAYNHAVRAPNISELFSPVTTGLTNLGTDPCSGTQAQGNANLAAVCIAQGATAAEIAAGTIPNPISGQANVTGGGNPFVKPETANTWTVGAVLRPGFLSGFNATVDYYKIKVKSAISSPTPADMIAACFGNITAASATDPACTVIRRSPLDGGLSGDPSDTPGLFAPLSNLGRIETDGIDVTVNYRTNIGQLLGAPAKLAFTFGGNYTRSSKFQATPTSINRECVGYYSVNCSSPQPKYTFNERTTLSLGRVDLSLLWRYINKVKFEPRQLADDLAAAVTGGCTDPTGTDTDGCMIDPQFRSIKSYNYFDFSTRFNVSEHFDLTFTVMNLFDKQPPVVGSSVGSTTFNSGNTYPSTYDTLGRRFAAGARIKF